MSFPGGSVIKNLPAMQETQVLSLAWEDPLEEEMATYSSIFAWRIPWTFHGEFAWRIPWSLADYSPEGHKELDMTDHTHTHTHTVLIKI